MAARACLLLLGTATLADAQPPVIPAAPPIHTAAQYTKHVRSVSGGSLSTVDVPGATSYKLVHLHGATRERGFAYGALLAGEIISLVGKMDDFCASPFSPLLRTLKTDLALCLILPLFVGQTNRR